MEERRGEGVPGLLCVHAHPDDEVFATGGVLAAAADRGLRTAVVTCTGGERGEIFSPEMDPAEAGPRLPEIRRAELERSLEILGAGPPRMLGYRDSGMAGTEGNDDPESFWRAPFDEAVGRLVGELRAFRPDVVVCYDAFGVYGHPDHIQAHRVGLVAIEAAAADLLYPEAGPAWRVRKVYLATLPRSTVALANAELAARGLPSPFGEETRPEALSIGTPDEEVTTVVDVRRWLQRKGEALRAHVSQVAPDSLFFNVPDELRERVFGTECFIRHRSTVPVPEPEDDLFAGIPGSEGAW